MTETIKPEPADPADPGSDDAPKPKAGDSFLTPEDADPDEPGGSGGDEGRHGQGVPPGPD